MAGHNSHSIIHFHMLWTCSLINGLQNCDWRLQDAFIWRFQDATFSVQVFYATLTFTTVTVVLVLPWIMPMKTREIKEVNEKLKSLSAPVVGLILQRSRIVTDNDGHYASSTTYLYPLTDGDTRQGLNNLQATMDSSLTGSGKTFTMQPLPLRAANDLVRQLHRPVYRNQKFKFWLSYSEIYGGELYDLLGDRKKLLMREDGRQQVCIVGLQEFEVSDVQISLITHSSSHSKRRRDGSNQA
ncbi:Kinesin-like protein KIN-13A [Lathyrus oleraceus]|uniref:Kinesin-like protein KIN-13A n=1 Tax=Pisum sativum TaxID=3888 RepID=A0A9D4Y060_PEA|nr:Kinesin-like protein KIN-13A [Pisum sativum]